MEVSQLLLEGLHVPQTVVQVVVVLHTHLIILIKYYPKFVFKA